MIRWLRRLRPGREGDDQPLARRGEGAAAAFLRRKGFRIIARNVSVGRDEADLLAIAPDGRTLVVVEVKTRASAEPDPALSVGREKQLHLARIGATLMKQRRFRGRPVRFDVIAIVWPEGGEPDVRHYESAFDSPF